MCQYVTLNTVTISRWIKHQTFDTNFLRQTKKIAESPMQAKWNDVREKILSRHYGPLQNHHYKWQAKEYTGYKTKQVLTAYNQMDTTQESIFFNHWG
jgi:hypothetical protein